MGRNKIDDECKFDKSFKIRLNKVWLERVDYIAEHTGKNKADVWRDALFNAYLAVKNKEKEGFQLDIFDDIDNDFEAFGDDVDY